MATLVTMPQLGESVTEGTITRWLKAEGEEVEVDEPLCEVDTDKVSAEIPSPFAGKIEKLLVSEGTTVEVEAGIAQMTLAGEWPAAEPVAQPVAGEAGESRSATARDAGNGGGAFESAETLRLRRSSPVVRRLAAEHRIDIAEVSGTGTGGRVRKKDIEGYIERGGAEREAMPAAPEHVSVSEGDRTVELTSIRRAIANRMSASKREVPHAWTMVEVDVTGLVTLRERVKEEFAGREGVRLTYLPFVVKAVVESLREHPVLNSVWDGDRIVLRKRINVGVAVDLEEDALIVPVIHKAEELNITGLARRIDDVVKRARSRQLSTGDISGGTFTVNNPGALGSVLSTPIINHPQAAILSAEAIVKRPVVIDDASGEAIAIRAMMNLEVSFDHRILDGGAALEFLNAVKQRLEGYGLESSIG